MTVYETWQWISNILKEYFQVFHAHFALTNGVTAGGMKRILQDLRNIQQPLVRMHSTKHMHQFMLFAISG